MDNITITREEYLALRDRSTVLELIARLLQEYDDNSARSVARVALAGRVKDAE